MYRYQSDLEVARIKQIKYVARSLSYFDVAYAGIFSFVAVCYALVSKVSMEVLVRHFLKILLIAVPVTAIAAILLLIGMRLLAFLINYLNVRYFPVKQHLRDVKEIRFTDKVEYVLEDDVIIGDYEGLTKIVLYDGLFIIVRTWRRFLVLESESFVGFSEEDLIAHIQAHNPDIKVIHSHRPWRPSIHY